MENIDDGRRVGRCVMEIHQTIPKVSRSLLLLAQQGRLETLVLVTVISMKSSVPLQLVDNIDDSSGVDNEWKSI